MQVTKVLILFLIYTLNASDTSVLTDSNSVSSPSSSSSILQMISSQIFHNDPPSHEVSCENQQQILKPRMSKRDLKIDLMETIAGFIPDSPMDLIFNTENLSLKEWIVAAKEMHLPAMFKRNLARKKRWDILIAINRWLIMEREETLGFGGSNLTFNDHDWFNRMLNEIHRIAKEERDAITNPDENNPEKKLFVKEYQKYFNNLDYVFLDFVEDMMDTSSKVNLFHLFCLDRYWRFDKLYKNENDLQIMNGDLRRYYLLKIFNVEYPSNISSLADLKLYFESRLSPNLRKIFLANPELTPFDWD